LPDGSFGLSGYTESFGAGQDDIYILKIDTLGNKIWEKTIGTNKSEMAFGITASYDSCLVVVGNRGSISGGAGNRDATLIKLSKEGNILWQKFYSSTSDVSEWGKAVVQTPDSGFLIAGKHDKVWYELENGLLIKTDKNGMQKWRVSIGEGTFYDKFESVGIDNNGNYFLGGTTSSPESGFDGYFVQTNNLGTVINKAIIGDGQAQAFYGAIQTGTGYLAAGQQFTPDSTFNIWQYFLPAFPPVSIPEKKGSTGLSIYPNPFSNKVTLEWDASICNIRQFEIYNSTQQLVKRIPVPGTKTACLQTSAVELLGQAAKEGVYFIIPCKTDGYAGAIKCIYRK
jgi:hypothetical protein